MNNFNWTILIPNIAIGGFSLILESMMVNIFLEKKVIIYENIGRIKKENESELIEDLRDRTGLDIIKVDIRQVDFLKDIAKVWIYFKNK